MLKSSAAHLYASVRQQRHSLDLTELAIAYLLTVGDHPPVTQSRFKTQLFDPGPGWFCSQSEARLSHCLSLFVVVIGVSQQLSGSC